MQIVLTAERNMEDKENLKTIGLFSSLLFNLDIFNITWY